MQKGKVILMLKIESLVMKKNLLILLACLLQVYLFAQQQGSTSNVADRLYDNGKFGQNVVLHNASGINTKAYEFSPAFYQNGLVYVSFHKNGPIDPKTGKPFFELFYASLDGQSMPRKAQPFSLSINSQAHEGPVTFSRDDDLIYFTRNNLESGIAKANSKRQVTMKIYEARRGPYDWEGIKALPFNNDEYTCFHPALSADGNRLFFSSDMPGGYGGFDLYYAEKKADSWSKPINLGANINTTGNEVFPFFHESGSLFFSSDGHGGHGGLDIFMVTPQGNDWLDPVNLGSPFNDGTDDLGFIINEEGTRGYFSSDRPGGQGEDDIYMFEADAAPLKKEAVMLKTTIIAYNQETNERIPNAGIRIFEQSENGFIEGDNLYDVQFVPSSDGKELMLRLVRKSDGQLGEPSLYTNMNGEAVSSTAQGKNYFLLVTKEGYESGELNYNTINQNSPQTVRVPLRPKKEVAKPKLPVNEILKEPLREGSVIVLENIYYDFNQFIIRKGAAQDLDALAQLMKKYPSMEIELIAHTDSRGTEAYNLNLSLKRAESAENYLVQKGISEDRIRAFGYGESQLRNRCKDGVECSDEEHQFNRRTEVKVIRIDEPVKVEYKDGNVNDGG
jgi:outer membrane protein OmpA-like peptidoglycan-associated protein